MSRKHIENIDLYALTILEIALKFIFERYLIYLGRGVFAKEFIPKGSFVAHYHGKLVKSADTENFDPTFLYEFIHGRTKYW